MPALSTESVLTDRQISLLAYWASMSEPGQLPYRKSLNPVRLRGALANTSLVEKAGDTFRFRLTGSRLEGVFGRRLKGQVIEAIDANIAEAGSASMDVALESGRPVSGHRRVGARWHCWLRVPLLDNEGNATLVLCVDEFPGELPAGRFEPDLHTRDGVAKNRAA